MTAATAATQLPHMDKIERAMNLATSLLWSQVILDGNGQIFETLDLFLLIALISFSDGRGVRTQWKPGVKNVSSVALSGTWNIVT